MFEPATSRSSPQRTVAPGEPVSNGATPEYDWPEVPLNGVTEIHVHGVGGASPADMLADPAPLQVSGDKVAGMWRAESRGARASGWHQEVHSWGGLTAGVGTNVLWLLFLPFALVNMTGWMTPTRDDTHQRHVLFQGSRHRGLIRVIGLLITAVYVLFVAQVSMDFVAFQCGGTPGCPIYDWLRPTELQLTDARRVTLGTAAPVALLALLGWLMHRTRARYELFDRDPGPDRERPWRDSDAGNPACVGLTAPAFWSGRQYGAGLAGVHLTCGLLIVALLLAATTRKTTESVLSTPLLYAAALGLAGMVPCAAWNIIRQAIGRRVLVASASVFLLIVVLDALFATPAETAGRPMQLPGIQVAYTVTLGGLMLGAALLLIVDTALARRAADQRHEANPGVGDPVHRRTILRHAVTPFAMVILALSLAAAPLIGAALTIATRLGTASDTPVSGTDIVYPHAFASFAVALTLFLGLFFALALIALPLTRIPWPRGTKLLAHVQDAWAIPAPGDHDARGSARWRSSVRRALQLPWFSLLFVQCVIWLLAGAATALVATYVGFATARSLQGQADRFIDQGDGPVAEFAQVLLPASLYVLTGLPLIAMFLLRRALRDPATNRTLSICWDVGTFWPRSHHPLAPPCYAERVIPELRARLERIWAAGGAVILCGHSQGAVLAAATVASLPVQQSGGAEHYPRRLSLVTYGNPMSRLYARFFPAYFDGQFVCDLKDRLSDGDTVASVRWRNFFRDTDLVGHQVSDGAAVALPPYASGVNVWLADPAACAYRPGDAMPRIRGHGHWGYRQQAEFAAYVESEVCRLAHPPSRSQRDL